MARGLNKVHLIGNLGGDPEMKYTPDGTAICRFSLATSYGKQDGNGNWKDETEWHRIVAWERTAEVAAQYLIKGSRCYVEGRIQSRKYTDNQGVERTSYEIVAGQLLLLDSKRDAAAQGGAGSGGGYDDEDVPF
jgi:single-strand DNA-binding protein